MQIMFSSKSGSGRYSTILLLVGVITSSVIFASCSNQEMETNNNNIVEVSATHDPVEDRHLFGMSTDEIPSGWTTFEFTNSSAYDHFFLIWKVPEEGVQAAAGADSLELYYTNNITVPFQEKFTPYIEGEIGYGEFTENLIDTLSTTAPWFFDPGAQTMGGPGLTAAGSISETTVYLEPGQYMAECYVKDSDETFHSAIGMLKAFTVTEDSSDTGAPEPTSRITISSEEGIQFDQDLAGGEHIFEIYFEDQQTYDHLGGHNVQLVRLEDKEDQDLLDELSAWMDWRQPGSLADRAPEGAEFMGGTMTLQEGETAYYYANLEPGDYAWIAEIPNPEEYNMLQTFTISE